MGNHRAACSVIFLGEAILFYLLSGGAFLFCFILGSFFLFYGGGQGAQQWKEHPIKRELRVYSISDKRYPKSVFVHSRSWVCDLFLLALSRTVHERGLHHATLGMFLLAVSVVIFSIIVNGIFCRP